MISGLEGKPEKVEKPPAVFVIETCPMIQHLNTRESSLASVCRFREYGKA